MFARRLGNVSFAYRWFVGPILSLWPQATGAQHKHSTSTQTASRLSSCLARDIRPHLELASRRERSQISALILKLHGNCCCRFNWLAVIGLARLEVEVEVVVSLASSRVVPTVLVQVRNERRNDNGRWFVRFVFASLPSVVLYSLMQSSDSTPCYSLENIYTVKRTLVVARSRLISAICAYEVFAQGALIFAKCYIFSIMPTFAKLVRIIIELGPNSIESI